ncbi:peroxiredoxin [Litorimonas cladophorae]|uniref:thioredoxin-dependent peroxiredoxin n=1 Tax=Litorimonas cladophorae TaxID=1220491 RepID=A0A918NC04_9PROT|nr:peroxiredoxin [Litorimonas cladophorae]GGX59231.1 peroxiredoxin [Litorimonas cladophorae]
MPTKLTDLKAGQSAPDFSMDVTGMDEPATLSTYSGRYLVLYFYPKDDTPGCTTEALGFTAHKAVFASLNADILGVSRDTIEKHNKFIAKKDLGIALGSDHTGDVTDAYGVWVEKSMYGKTYMGIQRATFLIGPDGTIVEVWPKVRVKGHVEDVLARLQAISA